MKIGTFIEKGWNPMNEIIVLLIAYLLGAAPFEKWFMDYQSISHTTPTFQSVIKQEILMVILIDLCRGVVATLVALWVGNWFVACLAAILVVVGSMYSIFYGFEGGRGLAVAAGALCVLSPVLILFGIVVYALSLLLTRYFFISTLLTIIAVFVLGILLATHLAIMGVIFFCSILILSRGKTNWKSIYKTWKKPYRFR
jgi:acyl phosphate:glycerol-3-phosphate acyltransferase